MTPRRNTWFTLAGLALAAFVATGTLWLWRQAPPTRPARIPPGDYSYVVAYANHRIDVLMKRHHLPSVAVALIDDQDTVWQQAFGLANVEREVPATVDTVYKLWSLAKVVTALEVMRLVDEGLLDLDAPITDYLPAFSVRSRFADAAPITARAILSHRSGLPRNGCRQTLYRDGDPAVLERLAASLQDCYLAYPVGYRYKYSNIGPDLLGAIIQQQRGTDFASYLRDRLLTPLGMAHSSFTSAGLAPHLDVALGYEYYRGDLYPYQQGDIANLPSGNLYSTLADMSRFVTFVLGHGQVGDAQLLAPETLALMFEDRYSQPHDPQPMGLGWKTARVLGDELLVWHDGGPSEGIGSLLALLPERGLGVVLFANEVGFEGALAISLATDILERMLATKFGIDAPAHEALRPVAVERAHLEAYAGSYIAYGQVMEITPAKRGLRARIGGMTLRLVPVGRDRFRVRHWLLELGLDGLLHLPIDLRELEIVFRTGAERAEDIMIIDAGGVDYEICPRYPALEDTPARWEALVGDYELVPVLASGRPGHQAVGRSEIRLEDGVLTMSGVAGPLRPISDTEVIILGSPFAGETLRVDPDSGELRHQSYLFRPLEPAGAATGR